jgi:hypothetical protein
MAHLSLQKFEDIKGLINRIRKPKNRQCPHEKKNETNDK